MVLIWRVRAGACLSSLMLSMGELGSVGGDIGGGGRSMVCIFVNARMHAGHCWCACYVVWHAIWEGVIGYISTVL